MKKNTIIFVIAAVCCMAIGIVIGCVIKNNNDSDSDRDLPVAEGTTASDSGRTMPENGGSGSVKVADNGTEAGKGGSGKNGSDIHLAEDLSGYKIDVYRLDAQIQDDDEDVLLDEFSDEIDQWIIDAIKAIGCDTAKSVLALPVEDIMNRADLEEETVVEVQKILRSEFEN